MVLNFFLGTAAELIKLHPLIARARERGWTVRLLATGQSSDNLEGQARDFGLDPKEFVWVVPRGQDLATSKAALKWFAKAYFAKLPGSIENQFAIVHGDTLSTLAGARLARKAGARVVHVEAGLRSKSLLNPFPEEITRRKVSRLADVHAAPDDAAVANLRRARVKGYILDTNGNTLMDAVRDGAGVVANGDYVLVNVHRFENVNSKSRWQAIIDTLMKIARDRVVIFIAHPQTRHRIETDPDLKRRMIEAGMEIRDRTTFSEFMRLLKSARYLVSDGGSNQEECSYLGIPCLLMREETERREGLDANCVLSRFDPKIIDGFLANPDDYRRKPAFADVCPSDRILDFLEKVGK